MTIRNNDSKMWFELLRPIIATYRYLGVVRIGSGHFATRNNPRPQFVLAGISHDNIAP